MVEATRQRSILFCQFFVVVFVGQSGIKCGSRVWNELQFQVFSVDFGHGNQKLFVKSRKSWKFNKHFSCPAAEIVDWNLTLNVFVLGGIVKSLLKVTRHDLVMMLLNWFWCRRRGNGSRFIYSLVDKTICVRWCRVLFAVSSLTQTQKNAKRNSRLRIFSEWKFISKQFSVQR